MILLLIPILAIIFIAGWKVVSIISKKIKCKKVIEKRDEAWRQYQIALAEFRAEPTIETIAAVKACKAEYEKYLNIECNK